MRPSFIGTATSHRPQLGSFNNVIRAWSLVKYESVLFSPGKLFGILVIILLSFPRSCFNPEHRVCQGSDWSTAMDLYGTHIPSFTMLNFFLFRSIH